MSLSAEKKGARTTNNLKKYEKVAVFPAPSGDPRDAVVSYMLAMANAEWTPKEDFTVDRRTDGRFKVNIPYKKRTVYTGMPYSNTFSSLEFFGLHLDGNVFSDSSYYFEDVAGNHCSASITLAFQQLVPFERGSSRPIKARAGVLEFPLDKNGKPILVVPDDDVAGDDWVAADLFAKNGREKIFESYSALDRGDSLLRSIPGTGHARMVLESHTETKDGRIDPDASYILCIEQTDKFNEERPGKVSTWKVGHKYTFSEMYRDNGVPATLCAYSRHETIKDAHIIYSAPDGAEAFPLGDCGTVRSDYPLLYVILTLKSENGETVAVSEERNLCNLYEYGLGPLRDKLVKDVPKGRYFVSVRAGIARGGAELAEFATEIG